MSAEADREHGEGAGLRDLNEAFAASYEAVAHRFVAPQSAYVPDCIV
jgi:hypothetical protein